MKNRFRILFVYALFSLVAGMLLPCDSTAASPKDLKKAVALNDSAARKVEALDFDGAEADLLAALEYSGQDPKLRKNLNAVYYKKGMRFFKTNNFYDAQKYLKLALESEPDKTAYRKAFAEALCLEAAQRGKDGQTDISLDLYQKAARYDKENVRILTQVSYQAWMAQRPELAREYLDRAKALDPKDKNVILMEKKISRMAGGSSLERQESEHFILSSPAVGGLAGESSASVLGELEKVYNDVSYRLGFSPKNKMAVVLYSAKDFYDSSKMPYRVHGYYDGKLNIPFFGDKASFETVKPMIAHELTHAFLNSLPRKNLPQWMNEGLAQWIQGKALDIKSKDALVTYQITRRLPDIERLDSALAAQHNPYNNTEMTLAYMKAFSLTEYLIEECGVLSLVRFAQEDRSPSTEDQVFKKYFRLSAGEIQENWLRWLERKKSNYVFN